MAEPNSNPQGGENTAEQQEKTFTQAQVDSMIGSRLAREREKYPSDDELSAFRKWQSEHESDEDKHNKVIKERDELNAKLTAAQAEIENFKHERYIASKGLTGEEAEFIAYKAAKLVSKDKTFEAAVDELLKDKKPKVTVSTGGDLGANKGGNKTTNEAFNALIRGARR